jgi:hypothetical protein
MAILTKPSVVRNVASTFTLNKADLAAEISDAYFQDTDNWSKVELSYVSSSTNQRRIVSFDVSNASPTVNGEFFVSDKSQGDFLINQITVRDYDGGSHVIKRADLNTAEFDVAIPVVALPVLVRTFNTLQQPWEDGLNTTFTGTHLALTQVALNGGSYYGMVAYGAEPIPVTFAGYYNIEVDYFDLTSSDATVTLTSAGPDQVVYVDVTALDGTAVFNNVLLSDPVYDSEYYFGFVNANTSIKVTEIRIYEA